MPDLTLACSDCGDEFTFPVRDQDFFKEKGWTPPKRCKACRQKRKAEKEAKAPKGSPR